MKDEMLKFPSCKIKGIPQRYLALKEYNFSIVGEGLFISWNIGIYNKLVKQDKYLKEI